jgi:hypothetical protein
MTKLITAAVAAAVISGATFAMSGDASAKAGNGHHHHGHHGSIGFFVAGNDYDPSCYLVKRRYNSGRPYFVEVCD